eukprot:gene5505-6859_t
MINQIPTLIQFKDQFNITSFSNEIHLNNYQPIFDFIPHLNKLVELKLVIIDYKCIKIPKGVIPTLGTLKKVTIFVGGNYRKLYQYTGETLEIDTIPSTVTNLEIDHLLFKNRDPRLIPESVQVMVIKNWTYISEEKLVIPHSVWKLTIENLILSDPITSGYFPSTLKEIYFKSLMGPYFYVKLYALSPGCFPDQIKHLSLSDLAIPLSFGMIPDSVESLSIYGMDGTIPPGIIPKSVRSVCLNFGRHVSNPIPEDTEKIVVSYLPISLDKQMFPSTLTHLTLGEQCPTVRSFPESLEFLDCHSTIIIIGLLPISLRTIIFRGEMKRIDIGSIPPYLTKLEFHRKIETVPILRGHLPESLLELKIANHTPTPFPCLPQSLISLDLRGNHFQKIPSNLDGGIPESVLHVKLTRIGPNQIPKQGMLPSRLTSLEIKSIECPNSTESVTDFFVPNTIQEFTLIEKPIDDKYKETIKKLLIKLININNETTNTRLIINIEKLKFMTFGSSDPYVYILEEPDLFFSLIENFTSLEELDLMIWIPGPVQIPKNVIPQSVKKLTLLMDHTILSDSTSLVGTLENGSLPQSLEVLEIDHMYFKGDIKIIPELVTDLTVKNWTVAKDEVGVGNSLLIPEGVKTLYIKNRSKVIRINPGSLPNSLTELFVPPRYNEYFVKILYFQEGSFPESIRKLTLSDLAVTIERNFIPRGCQELSFGNDCEMNWAPDSFPPNLTALNYSTSLWYLYPINGNLLRSLSTSIPSNYIPPTLIRLVLGIPVLINIQSITRLEFLDCSISKITCGLLPPTLKTLILRSEFLLVIEPGSIPESVEVIQFLHPLQFTIQKSQLPSTHLRKLKISCLPSVPFPWIPPKVTSLDLTDIQSISQLPIDSIPHTVTKLRLGNVSSNDVIIPKHLLDHSDSLIQSLEIKLLNLHCESKNNIDHNEIFSRFHIPKSVSRLIIKDTSAKSRNDIIAFYQFILHLITNLNPLIRITIHDLHIQSLGTRDPYIYCFNSYSQKEAFLHPDLGIGGAERLVVDSALALKSKGHKITIYTSRHDKKRSFKETHNGELEVRVRGDGFPRHFFNRFMVVCAIIRNLIAAFHLAFLSGEKYDVIFVDQISASVPILRWFTQSKILFYCHFPDKLLTSRDSLIKRLYRVPIDWFEEVTTSYAHEILVNSKFTASIFKQSFTRIKTVPVVLYPCLNLGQYDKPFSSPDGLKVPLYERKKNLVLALESFAALKNKLNRSEFMDLHLVFAGGYDPDLRENVEHLQELREAAESSGLSDKVSFVCSFNEEQKLWLLSNCSCMVYTPSNEHFGITPLEGMYAGKPVVAVNSGGPLETVKDDETGYLCHPDPNEFSNAIKKIVTDYNKAQHLGSNGRHWVSSQFSFESYSDRLNQIVLNI